MIRVTPFESRYFSLLSYILTDEESGECIIVDPAKEIASIIDRDSRLTAAVNTHIHFDHTLGNPYIGKMSEIHAHRLENKPLYRLTNSFVTSLIAGRKNPKTNFNLEEGDKFRLGNTEIKVMHTPGHSPGSICLHWDGNLISGDTMFTAGIGRTDIPHGSSLMIKNSLKRLLDLPGDTLVWPGHVYSSKYPVTLNENRRAIAWIMNSI